MVKINVDHPRTQHRFPYAIRCAQDEWTLSRDKSVSVRIDHKSGILELTEDESGNVYEWDVEIERWFRV